MNTDGSNVTRLTFSPDDDYDPSWGGGQAANGAPVLSNLAVSSPVNENDTATLAGNISDPNAGDSFALTVNWGDGSAPQVFNYAAGTTAFSETHQYLDDSPTATASDNYAINLTLSDNRGGGDSGFVSVVTNNVNPTLSDISVSPATITVGGSTTLSGSVNDVGSLDSHAVQINWGDGSPATTLDLAAGVSIFSATHQYNASGNFNLTLSANDDDGGTTGGGASINVDPLPAAPAAPSNLSATVISATRINLVWTDNAGTEQGFLIERCTGNGRCVNFGQIGQTGANSTVFADNTVIGNTNYAYRVRAFNAQGNSAYSNIAKAKTPRR